MMMWLQRWNVIKNFLSKWQFVTVTNYALFICCINMIRFILMKETIGNLTENLKVIDYVH